MVPPTVDANISKKAFTCIIADDSEFARHNMNKIITKLGGEVIGMAANGLETLDLYFRLKPDLLLLDITMPVLDGVATLRHIMEKDKQARVVIVSSIGHKEMIRTALDLGAKHLITKPYDIDYACMIVKSVMENGVN
jgi:two-component system chemotaxis response regulator CheY